MTQSMPHAQQSENLGTMTYSSGRVTPKSAWRTVVSGIFSFECLLVLFLFAGLYKSDPRLQWLPIDLTALFGGLSIIVGGYILVRRRLRVPARSLRLVLLMGIFSTYCAASLLWTPGRIYAIQKTLYIALLTLWLLAACTLVIAPDPRRIKRFLLLIIVFGAWVAFESTRAYLIRSTSNRMTSNMLGVQYLGLGRVLGLTILIMLAYRLYFTHNRFLKLGANVVLIYCYGLLLILGGRGPFLAAIIGSLVPLAAAIRSGSLPHRRLVLRRHALPLIGLVVVGIAATIYLLSTNSVPATFARLLTLFQEPGGGTSASVRMHLFSEATRLWSQAPLLGQGIGSFSLLTLGEDIRLYPHNLFLEVMAELGIIGLVMMGAMLRFAWRSLGPWHVIRDDPWRILILMLFMSTFFNAMISGDIADNRVLFGILGLMISPRLSTPPGDILGAT
jgi:O-antigen ligase